jgi:hypothetical protein
MLVGITVWEIQNQPLIDYKLESSDTLNLNYESFIQVNLMIRNRGGIDATVTLTLTVQNATIQTIQGTNIEYHENKTRIRILLESDMENWATGETLNVVPNNGTQTFSLYYEVTKEFDWLSLFYRLNPIIPTTLAFNQTQPNVYTKMS